MDEVKMYFVAIDIGCIECGEESALLGVFSSEDKAQRVCDKARKLQDEHWKGQHSFGVFVWNGKIDTAVIPSY